MEERFLKTAAEAMGAGRSEVSFQMEYGQDEKWDSLAMMNLLMELEEAFGVSIPLEKLADIRTLRDLYDLVRQLDGSSKKTAGSLS